MGMSEGEIDEELAADASRRAKQADLEQGQGNDADRSRQGSQEGSDGTDQNGPGQEARQALDLAGQTLADASDSPLEGNGKGLLVTWRNHGKSTES